MQATAAATAMGAVPAAAQSTALESAQRVRAGVQRVSFTLNGKPCELFLEPRVTLLDALREHLQLTGTKKGCDRGQCGACTVLANGRRINACLSLALTHEGHDIVTVEGLAGAGGALHPLQQAFVEHDAFQCGYCTPGQLCSALALLHEAAAGEASAATPDVRDARPAALGDEEIRERMSGNLCRCGAYPNIVAAIRKAAGQA
jgi:xanthine dehydrogenase YagT iron-sulfur-binding subunit